MKHVAVIGAGAWGTALAMLLERSECEVVLWARELEVVEAINRQHENPLYLPGIELPSFIRSTNKLKDVKEQKIIFLVAPAQFMGSTCEDLKQVNIDPSIPLIICSKGIERQTSRLMSEVVEDILPDNPIAILSGPTFASEVAHGMPVSVTLACADETLGKRIADNIKNSHFNIHYSNDIITSQIAGAVKNVIAIACGVLAGKEMGENAKAAMITQGVNEMRLLADAKGGRFETLLGPCGIGDLTLTCSNLESRNMSLGFALGKGQKLEEIMEERISVAEGIASADSVTALAHQLGVELPVCTIVNEIVSGDVNIEHMAVELMEHC